jgi:hypothetical protein
VERYIIERQAYHGGPWQFLAQFGEREAHDSYIARLIGSYDDYESVTVTGDERWKVVAIVRTDGSRARYKLRRESV